MGGIVTRSMADATTGNAQAAIGAGTDLVAGYVTGTGIAWTAAQFAAASAAGKTVVTIDQGAAGSPVPTAMVRDVQTGAWSAATAVTTQPWTPARPTIYTSLDNLPALQTAGWQGDVWVADYTGTAPSSPPAVPAGMTCVAVQWTDQGGGGAYDLSVVFDPSWPAPAAAGPTQEGTMLIQGASGAVYLLNGGRLHHIVDVTSLDSYRAAGLPTATVTQAEETALLTDFPPGNPAVTVTTPPPPGYTGSLTLTPQAGA